MHIPRSHVLSRSIHARALSYMHHNEINRYDCDLCLRTRSRCDSRIPALGVQRSLHAHSLGPRSSEPQLTCPQ